MVSELVKLIEERVSGIEPFNISFIGGIGAGKTQLLAAIHRGLSSTLTGVPIHRQTMKKLGKDNYGHAIESRRDNMVKGIARSSATVLPESFRAYGLVDNGLFPIDFHAPGGHSTAAPLTIVSDGLAYLVDTAFAQFANEKVQPTIIGQVGSIDSKLDVLSDLAQYVRNFDREGRADQFTKLVSAIHEGKINAEIQRVLVRLSKVVTTGKNPNLPDSLGYVICGPYDILPAFVLPLKKNELATSYFQGISSHAVDYPTKRLVTWKKEFLGYIAQSIVNALKAREDAMTNGTPVALMMKYEMDGNDRKDGALAKTESRLQKFLSEYNRYLSIHDPVLLQQTGIEPYDSRVPVIGDPQSYVYWGAIDSMREKDKVLHLAHSLVAATLEKKGIRAEGLRLVRYAGKDDPYTIRARDVVEK